MLTLFWLLRCEEVNWKQGYLPFIHMLMVRKIQYVFPVLSPAGPLFFVFVSGKIVTIHLDWGLPDWAKRDSLSPDFARFFFAILGR